MKSQKGMSYKMLIICVFILIVGAISIIYIISREIKDEQMQTYQTDMLLIQGKAKVLSQEATIQDKEEILKGEKLADKIEEEKIKELLDKKVINQEEDLSKYYVWNQQTLNDVGLENITLDNDFYIVNYETDEVIYSEGIHVKDKVYYKLSELKVEENEEEGENISQKTNI